jgi:hypothetical protein
VQKQIRQVQPRHNEARTKKAMTETQQEGLLHLIDKNRKKLSAMETTETVENLIVRLIKKIVDHAKQQR